MSPEENDETERLVASKTRRRVHGDDEEDVHGDDEEDHKTSRQPNNDKIAKSTTKNFWTNTMKRLVCACCFAVVLVIGFLHFETSPTKFSPAPVASTQTVTSKKSHPSKDNFEKKEPAPVTIPSTESSTESPTVSPTTESKTISETDSTVKTTIKDDSPTAKVFPIMVDLGSGERPLVDVEPLFLPFYFDEKKWSRQKGRYNHLIMDLLKEDNYQRKISSKDYDALTKEKEEYYEALDYYVRHEETSNPEKYDYWEDLDFSKECIRPKWTYETKPICNTFHELSIERKIGATDALQDYEITFLGEGHFRESFLFSPQDKNLTDIVLKHQRMERKFYPRNMRKVDAEAIIMEALSASSVTSDIYGYCSTSVMVEKGYELADEIVPMTKYTRHHGHIRQDELDEISKDDVFPMNKLSNERKLKIALAMAESLAEMHGFVGGAMTNDDISLYQWLNSEDGRVILNDFNDAIFLEWNDEKQDYCKYWRSFGGTFKAPEEYDGDYLDESVDIWPMGNLIFTLLTGLYPYYDEDSEKRIQELTKKGPPYIDPRYRTHSLIEGRLVEVMNKCHRNKAKERASIFEVVQHLRETKAMYEKEQENNDRFRRKKA